MNNAVKVDIWSDVACPWCYIGKRKFDLAAERFAVDGRAVEVEYHSYELSPDTPVDFEGSTVDYLAGRKGMAVAQVEQMLQQVTGIAASVGLDYDFASVRQTKTLKAHELLHYAKANGLQAEMKERLLRAYFTEGRHLGRIDELVALAVEVGLDPDEVRRALESGDYLDQVQADIDLARQYGINGVPFFVLDGKYGVSGAQQPGTFEEVLHQVWNERTTAR